MNLKAWMNLKDEVNFKKNLKMVLYIPKRSLDADFFFSPILKDAFVKEKIIVIDEIDKRLHQYCN